MVFNGLGQISVNVDSSQMEQGSVISNFVNYDEYNMNSLDFKN